MTAGGASRGSAQKDVPLKRVGNEDAHAHGYEYEYGYENEDGDKQFL